MAAGLGTRLRPLTDFLPKPMMPIANRPVLHHLLNLLHKHDIHEVGINLHSFPEMIQSYFGDGSDLGMKIHWSLEEELLGTAGGTKKLEDLWGGEAILVTSGDGLHDIDVTALLGHHKRTGALATLAVKPVKDPSSYGVVILDRDTRVRGFQEKPRPDEARSNLANCGVYVIEPQLLERIPAGEPMDFGQDLWPMLVGANEPLYAYTTMAYWNDVGDLDELRNSILDAVLGRVKVDLPGEEISPGLWVSEGCQIDPYRPDRRTRRARPGGGGRSGGPDRGTRRHRRRLPRREESGDQAGGAPARKRRAGRRPGRRGDLRRCVEARRQHPPVSRPARVVTLPARLSRNARARTL